MSSNFNVHPRATPVHYPGFRRWTHKQIIALSQVVEGLRHEVPLKASDPRVFGICRTCARMRFRRARNLGAPAKPATTARSAASGNYVPFVRQKSAPSNAQQDADYKRSLDARLYAEFGGFVRSFTYLTPEFETRFGIAWFADDKVERRLAIDVIPGPISMDLLIATIKQEIFKLNARLRQISAKVSAGENSLPSS